MESPVLFLLALVPIAIVFLLLVVLRWSARTSMAIAYLVTAAIALFVWGTNPALVGAATVVGVVTALTILFIVFGAILLLYTLEESGAIHAIRQGFTAISPDRRIQAILIAWLFGSLIEGASGFGTPAAIAAPLLVAIGFPAMAAVLSTLIIQSTPVSFGAVGTPILVGIQTGLKNQAVVTDAIAPADLMTYLFSIATQVAMVHAIVGFLIPLIVVAMLTRFFGESRSFAEGFRVWPFALFAGLAFTIPYYVVAAVFGPEFPSLLGGLIGLMITVPAARAGWFMPKETFDFPSRRRWEPRWSGTLQGIDPEHEHSQPMSLWRAWLPYVIVALLLVASRAIPEVKEFLTSPALTLVWPDVFGTGLNASAQPLYLPGAIFILVSLFTWAFHGMAPGASYAQAWRTAGSTMITAGPALLLAVPMVQVFINSAAGEIQSMPLVLAAGVSSLAGDSWPLVAPWIGAMGAFIAGSNTISNMMFSLFQFSTALNIGLGAAGAVVVVALQAVGGAAGNMICVHNVVAASATVGLVNREGDLIRMALIPMTYYAVQAGLLGMAILTGGLNLWWGLALLWAVGVVIAMRAGGSARLRTA